MYYSDDELKYNCCFVILHYKTVDETRACIESLLCLDDAAKNATVIVDNSYRLSDTGKKLFGEYCGRGNIYYVPNPENSFFHMGIIWDINMQRNWAVIILS